MSTSIYTNHPSKRWGLFLTITVASMCGYILGHMLVAQPQTIANATEGPNRFGEYSEIQQEDNDVYSQVMETEVPVSPGILLMVGNINGETSVESWDKSTLWIRAKKRVQFRQGILGFLGFGNSSASVGRAKKILNQTEVKMVQGSEDFRIETILPGYKSGVSAAVDYEILVPLQMDIEIDSVNGKVEIKHLQGNTKVESVNGKVAIQEIEGSVEAKTVNGKVEIQEVSGSIQAKTTNGKIEADDIAGPADLQTTNGKIELALISSPRESQEVRCETLNGAVELRLPRESGFHLDVRSQHGNIDCEFPVTNSEVEERNEIDGHVGDGGGLIYVRTQNGSINLKSD